MKKLIAIVLLVTLVATLIGISGTALAKPPGHTRDADVGKMLYKFNVLAVPNEWGADDEDCPNNGRRVFFLRKESGKIGEILWTLDPAASGFKITDCNGTRDGRAAIMADEEVNFYVFVRVHGKKTDSLDLTCEDVDNPTGNPLCLVGTVKLNKGKSFTRIMANVFEDEMEEVLWTLETSTGFRNAEVRIYEKL